jgi:hypothetical protein
VNSPHDRTCGAVSLKKNSRPGSRNFIKQELSQVFLNVARQSKQAQVLVSTGGCICRGKIAFLVNTIIFYLFNFMIFIEN